MGLGGIDLGATKIEARFFDAQLREVARNRVDTPRKYEDLVQSLGKQVQWLEEQGTVEHLGLGMPGLINPTSGEVLAANLDTTGRRLGNDLEDLSGRPVIISNDSRAFTLSEALCGAGRGVESVVGLIIGTGVAGGIALGGKLYPDLNGQGGEFGHLPLPADVVARYDLPLLDCGCGLVGCFETFISGPGIQRLARHTSGVVATAEEIFENAKRENIVKAWADIAAELVAIVVRTVDPEVIVLGGGVGTRPGVSRVIEDALTGKLLAGTRPPRLVPAEHGDASGALGAALFARQMAR